MQPTRLPETPWNEIEHRLFSYISANCRGQPLTSLAVIINLIASTRTKTGLRVRAELDTGKYPLGVEVPRRTSRPSGSASTAFMENGTRPFGPGRDGSR